MIRINLLKPLQSQAPAERMEELAREPIKSGRVWMISLLLLAAAGAGLYFAIQNTPSKPKAEAQVVALPQPAPVAAPQPEPPKPVVEAVDTVQASNVDPIFRLLKDLLAATPPGVGFSRIDFSAPGTFQIHGVASTEEELNKFQNALGATAGIELKADRVVPVGAGKVSREFFFSGNTGKEPGEIRTVPLNNLNSILENFSAAAEAQHVELETLQLTDSSGFHGKPAFHYSVDARCDYSDVQALLGKLQKSRSSICFQNMTLEARGGEKMAARFALVLYIQ